ncbi:vesicular, overexpressed in cancer, prosurvival protein 1-like [Ischnura elegans]|uniref:vesicular, overexpressed in cancer, prosurvival protein 1-like n=1 Tax=Ischnura elegans TaxID=197161 RepID=UPI001ED8A3F5|nr:vesicular, overexpressed in cancer, prosurvival protein 1-like [Ischnura elegans]
MARSFFSTAAIISIVVSLFFGIAFAYYCEWNLCGPDEYCCGDNYCCNSVYNLWYFWAGIVILAIMLWSCGGGLLRYCFSRRSKITVKPASNSNYVPLPSDPSAVDDMQQFHPCEDGEHLSEEASEFQMPQDVYGGREKRVANLPSERGPPPPYSKEPEATTILKMDTPWS